MTRSYMHMTPREQRARDERDLTILRLHDEGLSSHEISRRMTIKMGVRVGQTTVSKVLREIGEYLD